MNMIINGLYLGSLDAANDTSKLKMNGITHILTVAMGLCPMDYKVIHYYKILMIVGICMEKN